MKFPISPLPALLVLPWLAACGLPVREAPSVEDRQAVAVAAETPPAESVVPVLPDVALTPGLLHRFLLAEIAGQRGLTGESVALYLELARETRDPRIARRATEIALHGRRPAEALAAARLWLEAEPGSPAARQTFISLLAANDRYDELGAVIAALLAVEPRHLGQNLAHLNRLFARARDRQAVRRLVEQVTEPYLHQAEAHYARALVAHEMRDMPAALASIRRALELRPNWETAALARAQLTEDRALAIEELGRFAADHPHAREARLAHARLLTAEKRYAEARAAFRRLLEPVAPGEPPDGDIVFAVAVLSLQLEDRVEAERLFKQLVASGYADVDKVRLHLGQIAAEGRRWDEAQHWFGKVGPGEHFLAARLQAAAAYARQGEMERARALLAATRAAEPRLAPQLLLGEAQLLREQNRTVDAHALLAEALKVQPDQPELLYETALLAEKLGRLDELERHLRRLIALQPDHAHAHNALGYSLADRNIRLDEARALIARALELAPNDPFILDSEGWVLYRLGDKQGALVHLQRAYALRPDPEIAAHLGEVLWMLDRHDEARAVWEKARREHPANDVLAETVKRFLP